MRASVPSLFVLTGLALAACGGGGGGGGGPIVPPPVDLFSPATPAAISIAPAAPTRAVIADFNFDGKPDVVTTNPAAGTVSVFLGDGAGHLTLLNSYAAGADPQGLAVADLNADTFPDVIVTNFSANTVSVLLNTGGTALGTATPTGTLAGPIAVVAAPIDAGAAVDVVVVCGSVPVAQRFLGDGAGGFLPLPLTIALPGPGLDVAAGDIDGDLDIDVAFLTTGVIQVMSNNGSGTLAPTSTIPATVGTKRIGFANVTVPAGLDLVTTNTTSDTFVVFPNDGTGLFSIGTSVATATGDGPIGFAVGDVDGDTIPDVLVACSAADQIRIHLGNGDGTFQPSLVEPVGDGPDTPLLSIFGPASTQGLAVSETNALDVYVLNHN